MNETLKVLETRRSCRNFKSDMVSEDDPELMGARVALITCTGQVLRNVLGILGVDAPESM